MFDLFKRNPKAVSLAVAMHLVLILLLIFGLDWLVPPKDQRPAVNIVKAQVVDASAVAAEAKRIEDEKTKLKAQEQEKKDKAERELKELQKKRETEQKKLQEAEKQRKELEQRRKLEAEQARKLEIEKKRKAEAEAKKQEEAKKAEQKRKTDEEAKRKAEADKKRKADEERAKREAELQRALEAEQSSQQNAQVINAFALAVTERVTSNWVRPPATDLGLKVKLRVRVSDNGSVLAVQVVQTSGNSAFDRSAEAAVYKSDPLPTPPPGVRELNFTFDPDRV